MRPDYNNDYNPFEGIKYMRMQTKVPPRLVVIAAIIAVCIGFGVKWIKSHDTRSNDSDTTIATPISE